MMALSPRDVTVFGWLVPVVVADFL